MHHALIQICMIVCKMCTVKQMCKCTPFISVCSHIYSPKSTPGEHSCSFTLITCVFWSFPSSLCLEEGMRASQPVTFPFLLWPVPRCICRGSSLSLQKAQRKKIRKLSLMKTRSTVSFPRLSLSLPLSPPSHPPPSFCRELGKTREEEN